ncbi:hypothetical protein ACJX0J_037588 [Zea mays]
MHVGFLGTKNVLEASICGSNHQENFYRCINYTPTLYPYPWGFWLSTLPLVSCSKVFLFFLKSKHKVPKMVGIIFFFEELHNDGVFILKGHICGWNVWQRGTLENLPYIIALSEIMQFFIFCFYLNFNFIIIFKYIYQIRLWSSGHSGYDVLHIMYYKIHRDEEFSSATRFGKDVASSNQRMIIN